MPPKRKVPPPPTPTPEPELPKGPTENALWLRKQEKWAAVCQFFFTFGPALNVADYTVAVGLGHISVVRLLLGEGTFQPEDSC